MPSKLHLALTLATALGTSLAPAQDGPPPRPPVSERPPGPPARPENQRPENPRPPQPPRPDQGPEGGPRDDHHFPPPPAKPTAYLGVGTGHVPPPLAAQLGLTEGFGLVVEDIMPDSPANSAGLQRFDVLKLINDQLLVDPGQLATLVRFYGKDAQVTLTLLRAGQEQKVTLKVAERLLPERRPLDRPVPGGGGNLLRELGSALRPMEPKPGDPRQRLEERSQKFNERVRDFQERLEKWRAAPNGAPPPEPPTLDPPAPRPPDLLREARPGGASSVQQSTDDRLTVWNTGGASLSLRDETGQIEVRNEAGHHTLVATDPAGATLFTGPLDTAEQRASVPAPIREKLDRLDAQSAARPELPFPSAPLDGMTFATPPEPPAGVEFQ